MECCKVFSSPLKVGSPALRPSTRHGLKLSPKVPKVKLQARVPLQMQAMLEYASQDNGSLPVTVNGPPVAMSIRSPKRTSTNRPGVRLKQALCGAPVRHDHTEGVVIHSYSAEMPGRYLTALLLVAQSYLRWIPKRSFFASLHLLTQTTTLTMPARLFPSR